MRDGVVPELHRRREPDPDRQRRAAVLTVRLPPLSRDRRHSDELVAEFDVKTPSLDTPARNLSGGNIQKLILARELSRTRAYSWRRSRRVASTSARRTTSTSA